MKKILPVIFVLVGLIVWFYQRGDESVPSLHLETSKNPKTQTAQHNKEQDSHHDHHQKASPHLKEEVEKINQEVSKSLEKTRELVSSYRNSPSSEDREELIRVIVGEDPFKRDEIQVAHHSESEALQAKLGAQKVLALRALMGDKARGQEAIKRDLVSVIRQAKDPTMKSIASQALKSLEKGEDFFENVLDGIDNMKLE